MLRNRTIVLMTLLAMGLGVLLAGQTFAGCGTAPAGEKIWARLARQLELSTEQQAQIKDRFLAEKDRLHSVLERVHNARLDLREAIHAPEASESTVRTAAAQVAAAEADLAVDRLKLYRDINPLLNPVQRQKLAALEQHVDEFVDTALGRLGDGPAN